jgi:hypothetical protein
MQGKGNRSIFAIGPRFRTWIVTLERLNMASARPAVLNRTLGQGSYLPAGSAIPSRSISVHRAALITSNDLMAFNKVGAMSSHDAVTIDGG